MRFLARCDADALHLLNDVWAIVGRHRRTAGTYKLNPALLINFLVQHSESFSDVVAPDHVAITVHDHYLPERLVDTCFLRPAFGSFAAHFGPCLARRMNKNIHLEICKTK